jgi:hypothetical protein
LGRRTTFSEEEVIECTCHRLSPGCSSPLLPLWAPFIFHGDESNRHSRADSPGAAFAATHDYSCHHTMWITGVIAKATLLAPLVRVLSHGMRNEESESRDRFVVMIVLLFILSAALMAVLMLFSTNSLDGSV